MSFDRSHYFIFSFNLFFFSLISGGRRRGVLMTVNSNYFAASTKSH